MNFELTGFYKPNRPRTDGRVMTLKNVETLYFHWQPRVKGAPYGTVTAQINANVERGEMMLSIFLGTALIYDGPVPEEIQYNHDVNPYVARYALDFYAAYVDRCHAKALNMRGGLLDATMVDAVDMILAHVESKIGKAIRENERKARIETAHYPLTERPKNATERRQAAVAVFQYKHVETNYDMGVMLSDLDKMRKLGRTERWQNALTIWMNVLQNEADTDWAITQYSVYTAYKA